MARLAPTVALTVALASVVGLAALPANAETTTPYPGVVHVKEAEGGQRRHVVTIDLARPSLSMHVSAEANRKKVVSAIAKAEGAVIAVNASFFKSDYSLCGIAVARGTPWTKIDDDGCIHGIAWGTEPSRWQLFSTLNRGTGPFPEGTTEIVSGYPTLLKGGVLCDGSSSACSIPSGASSSFRGRNPRTFLGVDASRTKAFLVVVDGRDGPDAVGLSLVDSMKLMKDLGAHDAINLDGGGSTELWIDNEGGVVNEPSDGKERVVASAVLVAFDPSKEPVVEDAGADVGVEAGGDAGDGDSGSGSGSGSDSGADAGEPVPEAAATSAEAGGCGCRTGRAGGAGLAIFAGIAGVAVVLRRRVQRRA